MVVNDGKCGCVQVWARRDYGKCSAEVTDDSEMIGLVNEDGGDAEVTTGEWGLWPYFSHISTKKYLNKTCLVPKISHKMMIQQQKYIQAHHHWSIKDPKTLMWPTSITSLNDWWMSHHIMMWLWRLLFLVNNILIIFPPAEQMSQGY